MDSVRQVTQRSSDVSRCPVRHVTVAVPVVVFAVVADETMPQAAFLVTPVQRSPVSFCICRPPLSVVHPLSA